MSIFAFLQISALTVMLGSAVFMDLRERRIPNRVTLPGLLVGLILAAMMKGGFPFSALAGSGLGLVVALPLLALGGIGGGDAKLLTAVGAFVGVGGLFSVVFYGALAGGVLALGSAIQRGDLLPVLIRSGRLFVNLVSLGRWGDKLSLNSAGAHSVPYGVAIAVGALATWFAPFSLGGSL